MFYSRRIGKVPGLLTPDDGEIIDLLKQGNIYGEKKDITMGAVEVPIEKQIPRELIIAQAAIETGWGKSRFANEANNLFGIRTWEKSSPHLLPQGIYCRQ